MRHVIRAALQFDGVALGLARRLRKRCGCEYRGEPQQRRKLRRTFQRVDHFYKSFCIVAGSRRFNRSKISNVTAVKNSSGPHHFRFPVSLQADCCYFYGMADSRFF
jgi:hypothetical protein